MGHPALIFRCTKPGCGGQLETPFSGANSEAAALSYARKKGWRTEGFMGICPDPHAIPVMMEQMEVLNDLPA